MSMFSRWACRTLANPDTKKNLTPACVKYSSGALINEVSESGRGNQDAFIPRGNPAVMNLTALPVM
jgi:hypothetical protein